MPKMKRVIEVEGEFVVMTAGDTLPIANGLANEWEAAAVAVLCTLGPYKDTLVSIAFNPVDGESRDDLIEDDRIWYNGIEYQAGDDLREPADYLLWVARYGYGQGFRDEGKPAPDGLWDQSNASMTNEAKKWLIDVAIAHEVHPFLPADATTQEADTGSADRYHMNLLRDIVRNPEGIHLDTSERKGLLETLDRVQERAGLAE